MKLNKTQELNEDDIGSLFWASQISGLPESKLAARAKDGGVPGSFKLGGGIGSWRFYKPKFLEWLKEQIASKTTTPEPNL